MRSDIFPINSDVGLDQAIPHQIEYIAAFYGLGERDILTLRLLAEEMISLVLNILKKFEGKFWLENKDKNFELHMEVATDVSLDEKENLLSLSAGANYAAKGILGKINAFFENMALSSAQVPAFYPISPDITGDLYNVGYTGVWSVQTYMANLSEEERKKEWDGLEKSILINMSDDVIMGVKSHQVLMIVKKGFK